MIVMLELLVVITSPIEYFAPVFLRPNKVDSLHCFKYAVEILYSIPSYSITSILPFWYMG